MRRLERLARNQMLFRNVNQRVNAARGLSVYRDAYLCECSRRDCVAELDLARAEYEAVRQEPTHFVIKVGHHVPEIERVVEQNDRYAVVEKVGEAQGIVTEGDPGAHEPT